MIGEMVSHYRIEKKLGGGAMGVVYLAEDTRLRRPVALKFLPPEMTSDELANTRFLREARLASSLDHPNICVIHEIDKTSDGSLFLVMARYEGQTLKALLQKGPLSPSEALDLARQAAAGLARASESGLIHRDIKPANLMITSHGELKIIDFGLARLQTSRRVTRTGTLLGTVTYMSPEQLQGRDATHATDIWALGVVLQEILTGEPPFHGPVEAALLYSIVNEEPRPLELADKRAQAVCGPILTRCLAKEPKQRFQSAAELEKVLAAAARTLAPRVVVQDRILVPQLHRRRSRRIGMVAVLLLLILAAMSPQVRDGVWRLVHPGAQAPVGVAVLPFVTPDADAQQQALGDGLTWLITERLQDMRRGDPSFWVVPQSMVIAKSVRTPEEARLMLGVNRTLRGVFQPEGSLWRLTLQVHDSRAGRTWTREFQDDLANLETWQEQVPTAAARLLDLRISEAPTEHLPEGCTSVPAAFVAWVQGLGWLNPAAGSPDLAKARSSFHEAVAQDSSFARARTGVATAIWLGEGRQDSLQAWTALGMLVKAAAMDSNQAWPHVIRAQILSRWSQPEEAIQAYQRASAVDPYNPVALHGLGGVLARLGDEQGAEAAYVRLAEFRPNYGAGINSLGVFYYRQARFEKAASAFQRGVVLTPGDVAAYNNLGATLFELERYDEALRMFEKSLRIKPNHAAYTNLGSLYFFRHRYTDAIGMFKHALAIEENQYWVWGNLAEAHFWAPGQQDSARIVYPRAIKLAEAALDEDPESAFIKSTLATYYARLGHRQKTLEQLDQVVTGPDLTAEVMFNVADAYEQIGERGLALDWLDRACAADLSIAKVELYPGLNSLRADVRFREIMSRYGI